MILLLAMVGLVWVLLQQTPRDVIAVPPAPGISETVTSTAAVLAPTLLTA